MVIMTISKEPESPETNDPNNGTASTLKPEELILDLSIPNPNKRQESPIQDPDTTTNAAVIQQQKCVILPPVIPTTLAKYSSQPYRAEMLSPENMSNHPEENVEDLDIKSILNQGGPNSPRIVNVFSLSDTLLENPVPAQTSVISSTSSNFPIRNEQREHGYTINDIEHSSPRLQNGLQHKIVEPNQILQRIRQDQAKIREQRFAQKQANNGNISPSGKRPIFEHATSSPNSKEPRTEMNGVTPLEAMLNGTWSRSPPKQQFPIRQATIPVHLPGYPRSNESELRLSHSVHRQHDFSPVENAGSSQGKESWNSDLINHRRVLENGTLHQNIEPALLGRGSSHQSYFQSKSIDPAHNSPGTGSLSVNKIAVPQLTNSMSLTCRLCNLNFRSIQYLEEHTISKHSIPRSTQSTNYIAMQDLRGVNSYNDPIMAPGCYANLPRTYKKYLHVPLVNLSDLSATKLHELQKLGLNSVIPIRKGSERDNETVGIPVFSLQTWTRASFGQGTQIDADLYWQVGPVHPTDTLLQQNGR